MELRNPRSCTGYIHTGVCSLKPYNIKEKTVATFPISSAAVPLRVDKGRQFVVSRGVATPRIKFRSERQC